MEDMWKLPSGDLWAWLSTKSIGYQVGGQLGATSGFPAG